MYVCNKVALVANKQILEAYLHRKLRTIFAFAGHISHTTQESIKLFLWKSACFGKVLIMHSGMRSANDGRNGFPQQVRSCVVAKHCNRSIIDSLDDTLIIGYKGGIITCIQNAFGQGHIIFNLAELLLVDTQVVAESDKEMPFRCWIAIGIFGSVAIPLTDHANANFHGEFSAITAFSLHISHAIQHSFLGLFRQGGEST